MLITIRFNVYGENIMTTNIITLRPDSIKNLRGLDAETRGKIKEGLGVIEHESDNNSCIRYV